MASLNIKRADFHGEWKPPGRSIVAMNQRFAIGLTTMAVLIALWYLATTRWV